MLGWTILFGMMSLSGVAASLAAHPASFFVKAVSLVFATLFFLSLLTRAVRGRTHG